MYIGIDIGYLSVKLCYGAGPHPSQQQLPVGAAPKSRMMKGMNGETLVGQGHLVMVNDEEWVAGINPEDIQGFVRIMDKQYPETKEYLALYRAALSRVGVAKVDRAVIGLPMFQFLDEEARAKLRERLKGRHYIRPGFTVDVVDVAASRINCNAVAEKFDLFGQLFDLALGFRIP